MNHIGEYKGYPVYQIDWNESTEYAPNRILVDPNGRMWYGGIAIGRLDPSTYSVKQFDMSLFERSSAGRKEKHKKERAAEEKREKEAAEAAKKAVMEIGNDKEFFDTIAAEVDALLKGVSLYE